MMVMDAFILGMAYTFGAIVALGIVALFVVLGLEALNRG